MPALSHRGRLLVATPLLTDPNFDRTVILVLEHGDEGALGLVLNRPVDTDLAEPLPEWAPLAAEPRVVFSGGPVAPEAVIALARSPAPAETGGFTPVFDALGSVDLAHDPLDLGVPLDTVRVWSGYAGWAPGQLEDEILEHAWFVVDAGPDDAFTDAPAGLWRRVLRRQRGELAMYAHCPADASVN